MPLRLNVLAVAFAVFTLFCLPNVADAQLSNRIRRAAERAAERETVRQVDRQVTNVVRCVLTDQACIDKAKAEGRDVEVVDGEGNVVSTAAGSAADSEAGGAPRPGEGAWANYDFVPGEEILVYDDYAGDVVGDFPRRFELVEGNWEIIEWQGERFLRATSDGILAIPLPKTLPERFTIEFDASIDHGNAWVRIVTERAFYGRARTYRGSAPTFESARSGVRPVQGMGPTVLSSYNAQRTRNALLTFRVMADGNHMKVYLGEDRVANVPNAVYPRSDTLYLAVGWARAAHPILIGAIRVAGGGRSLYDALARDGRVATQGIFFDTGSDRIRAESTPTLKEITTMLQQHDDLRIIIEGHTDSVGDDEANQTLSERRAAAVKGYLEGMGIEASRLESRGFGESRPAVANDTPEGRQQNRRVELVRIQ